MDLQQLSQTAPASVKKDKGRGPARGLSIDFSEFLLHPKHRTLKLFNGFHRALLTAVSALQALGRVKLASCRLPLHFSCLQGDYIKSTSFPSGFTSGTFRFIQFPEHNRTNRQQPENRYHRTEITAKRSAEHERQGQNNDQQNQPRQMSMPLKKPQERIKMRPESILEKYGKYHKRCQ